MASIRTFITLGEDELGNIDLVFVCEGCSETANVDPTFFQTSGNPICGNEECPTEGDDMVAFAAHITVIGDTK